MGFTVASREAGGLSAVAVMITATVSAGAPSAAQATAAAPRLIPVGARPGVNNRFHAVNAPGAVACRSSPDWSYPTSGGFSNGDIIGLDCYEFGGAPISHSYADKGNVGFTPQIRYSSTCHAAWGWIYSTAPASAGPDFGFTAWNPGRPSQQVAGGSRANLRACGQA